MGDAIIIPPLWWHHVESLESFNMLVNYWWHDNVEDLARADSGFDAHRNPVRTIRGLLAVQAVEARGIIAIPE